MRYLVVVLLVAAGCLQAPAPTVTDGDTVEAAQFHEFSATGCETMTTFMLVGPDVPAPLLPPGFFPRGLDDFEPFTPVMFGQIPAYLATIRCDRADPPGDTVEVTFAGYRVYAPDFTETDYHPRLRQVATYDFYANHFWAGNEAQADYMASIGWDAEILKQAVEVTNSAPMDNVEGSPIRNIASWSQTVDSWFKAESLAGYAELGIPGDALIRFWHMGPDGLGAMEFQLQEDMEPTAGVAGCSTFVAGSPIDKLTLRGAEDREGAAACLPQETFTLTFAEHSLEGGYLFLPGIFKP